MNQHERNEKIELYGCGYDLLIDALKDIPREMWKFHPAPGEWSVHEVLVHLADSESNAALRARKLIVDMSGVSTIDSSGVGELVGCYTTATHKGAKVKLMKLPAKISDVLTVTQLITVFDVYTDEPEARVDAKQRLAKVRPAQGPGKLHPVRRSDGTVVTVTVPEDDEPDGGDEG